jgi:hypothetical protein
MQNRLNQLAQSFVSINALRELLRTDASGRVNGLLVLLAPLPRYVARIPRLHRVAIRLIRCRDTVRKDMPIYSVLIPMNAFIGQAGLGGIDE